VNGDCCEPKIMIHSCKQAAIRDDGTIQHLNGQLIDPLKTTIVQNERCMATWVVRKG
jgi:hypothetical protein